MKKKLFFFTFFCFFLALDFRFFFVSPILAFDPIIIRDSLFGAPPVTQVGASDVDFRPNEIDTTDSSTFIKCPSTGISLENHADPRKVKVVIGIDENSQPVTGDGPDWDRHEENLEKSQEIKYENIPYSNKNPENSLIHLGNRAKVLIGDALTLQKTFLSFDLNKPFGASNMANRSTPSRVLNCLKGQRLVKAVESLKSGPSKPNDTTCNEQIAWNCNNQITSFALSHTPPSSGCTPVRLSDIASVLSTEQVFQNTSVNCQSPEAPPLIPLPVSKPSNTNPLTIEIAQKLLKTGVEITDNCSIARTVEICNYDLNGKKYVCSPETQKDVSIPLGGILYTANDAVNQTISKTQKVPEYNVCQTKTQEKSANIPNPISFLAKIFNAIVEVFNETVGYNQNMQLNYYIDKRIQEPLKNTQAFNKNLIPNEVQLKDKEKLKNTKGSSTNGVTIDPGNDDAGEVARKLLLPASWQVPSRQLITPNPNYIPGAGVTQWCSLINRYAYTEIPANVIAAIITVESGGDPDAYSGSGAVGLMQVIPSDGIAAQYKLFDRPTIAQLKVPDFNINYAVNTILAGNLSYYGNINDALIHYGPMDYDGYDTLVLGIAAANPNICN